MTSLGLLCVLAAGAFAGSSKNAPLSPVPALPRPARGAASLVVQPLAAAPVPAAVAALAQAQAVAAPAAEAASDASPESRQAQAARAFDGAAPSFPVDAPPAQAAGALPSYLRAAHPEHSAWLAKLVSVAKRSKTARAVLRDAEKLSARQGRPVLVVVGEPRGWAAFDFDTELMWMTNSSLGKAARNGAAALIHELRHTVQLGAGLPDIFELELDAYMFDFRVAFELGDKAGRGTFDAQARAAFRRGPEDFIRYLRRFYKADVARHGRAREYRADLEKWLNDLLASRERAGALVERRREVLDAMKAAGYPAENIEAYVDETLAPSERRAAGLTRLIASVKRDLALHDDPVSRRRAADFARRAVERLHRLSGSLDVR